MAENRFFPGSNKPLISIVLVVGLTMIALFTGRLIKDNLENRTFPYERGGIQVQIHRGWGVQNGIDGENTLFTTSDPFDLTHRYMVSILPAAEGNMLTDTVVTRNLEMGLALQHYKVLDQASVRIGNSDGFRVKFVYVDVPRLSNIPVVVMGVDYYIPDGSRVVVISMEDQSSRFEEVYPAFIKFLNRVVFTKGG